MLRNFAAAIILLSSVSTSWCQENSGRIAVISTIHGAHKANTKYTYDSLFHFIQRFKPDIIGVEIRAEDMDSSIAYLASNYPFEMYECRQKFPGIKVLGFDWLGGDLEGRAIPKNYWKENSNIKQLQSKLAADSAMQVRLAPLKIIQEEKNRLALGASLAELNDGRYDLINSIYYRQLQLFLEGTEYAALSEFYQQRDAHIAQNIVEIIKKNPGKRMIFLLGADHRGYVMSQLIN